MSHRWAIVLVAVTFMSVGAFLGTLVSPRSVEAAKEPVKIAPPRIAYVNIAKVLRSYDKANADGQGITNRRQEYVEKAKVLREAIAAKDRHLLKLDEDKKAEVEKEKREIQRKIEDLDQEAQQILGKLTDKVIVDVYQDIKIVVAEFAKERGLDVVEFYPDASDPEDDRKPAVAQLKLQTPALIPMYIRPELLVTDEIIERLNKKFPVLNR